MRKTKITLAVGAVLTILGAALFAITMAILGWNFYKLETQKLQTKEYEITDAFINVAFDTDTADLVFLPSQTEKCTVVCREYENAPHAVRVENQTLTVVAEDNGGIKNFIGISFRLPKITVYLPQAAYGSLSATLSTGDVTVDKALSFQSITVKASTGNVKCYATAIKQVKISLTTGDVLLSGMTTEKAELSTSTGTITMNNVACTELTLSASTGDAFLTAVTCETLHGKATTGDITLTDVIASQKITLIRNTGDVKFVRADAKELYVKTSTGDVKGSLCSGKTFFVQTNTGKKRLPQGVTGGRCDVITDTGDIILEIVS